MSCSSFDPCARLFSGGLSTLEGGGASGTAAEPVDELTMVDSTKAVVVEVASLGAGSSVSMLSKGGGGVFKGSSISIDNTKPLLFTCEALVFLFESAAADEAPCCLP